MLPPTPPLLPSFQLYVFGREREREKEEKIWEKWVTLLITLLLS